MGDGRGEDSPRAGGQVLVRSVFTLSRIKDKKAQPGPGLQRSLGNREGQKFQASLTFIWYIIISLARWLRYWASFTFLYRRDWGRK